MKRILTSIALAASLAAGATSASATVLNFDDLTASDEMPATYGGLDWSGWSYYDIVQFPYTPASAPTRLYDRNNDNAFSSASGFTFQGADFSGASTTSVRFDMYLHGSLVASSVTVLTSALPAFLSSGYSGLVDKVVVISNAPQYFVMDNVTINAVPEPETYAMMLAGLGLLGFMARRKA